MGKAPLPHNKRNCYPPYPDHYLIQYYLLVKNNEEEGRGPEREGGLLTLFPRKGGAGLFERGGFIENLRNKFQIPVIYCNEAFSVIKNCFSHYEYLLDLELFKLVLRLI